MYGTVAMEPVSFSHIPGFSPQAHQMLEICASISPPEPIDELNDQELSVIKKLKTAITTIRFVFGLVLVSIKISDYLRSSQGEVQDGWACAIRVCLSSVCRAQ